MNVLYYNENLVPKEFELLTDHKDGTVTIGSESKPVVVHVKVVDVPTAGCVTLGTEVPAVEGKKSAASAAVRVAKKSTNDT